MDFASGTEYPERLTAYQDPVLKFEGNSFVVTPDYKDMYDGMSQTAIETEMMKTFYRGVHGSRTKKDKPEMFETLEEMVRESLEQRYGVDVEDLKSGMSR